MAHFESIGFCFCSSLSNYYLENTLLVHIYQGVIQISETYCKGLLVETSSSSVTRLGVGFWVSVMEAMYDHAQVLTERKLVVVVFAIVVAS